MGWGMMRGGGERGGLEWYGYVVVVDGVGVVGDVGVVVVGVVGFVGGVVGGVGGGGVVAVGVVVTSTQ
jgi:hypothetical protein